MLDPSEEPLSGPCNYRTEFPNFGELDVALPDGFRDISRRIDGMPSFAKTLSPHGSPSVAEILLTIDAADPARRMDPEAPRFTLMVMQDHTELLASFESDEFNEILASIAVVEEEYHRQTAGLDPERS